jgi:hypothetical protein
MRILYQEYFQMSSNQSVRFADIVNVLPTEPAQEIFAVFQFDDRRIHSTINLDAQLFKGVLKEFLTRIAKWNGMVELLPVGILLRHRHPLEDLVAPEMKMTGALDIEGDFVGDGRMTAGFVDADDFDVFLLAKVMHCVSYWLFETRLY